MAAFSIVLYDIIDGPYASHILLETLVFFGYEFFLRRIEQFKMLMHASIDLQAASTLADSPS